VTEDQTRITSLASDGLRDALTIADLESLARQRMDPAAYDYCAGGSGAEATLAENLAAFARRRLRPRALVGVAKPALATTVLGRRLELPIGVAPVSLQRLAHAEGEVASARAAADLAALFCLSTFASRSMEEVAAGAGPGVRWLQLYLLRDRGVTASLLDRASAAGYDAVCVTVDVPVAGRRHRDLRNGFRRFMAGQPALLRDLAPQANGDREAALARLDAIFPNPRATWADFEWVCSRTSLPVLAKGVLRRDDARLALGSGARGVVVSNHGGRQLDRAVPSIDALAEVVQAVAGEAEVLLDSGVRSGADVLVALALGARAVLVGRPVVWGLAADRAGSGVAGARRALELLRDGLAEAMVLAGAGSVDALDPSFVA
jgi:4-hydroxymandelate oxidase